MKEYPPTIYKLGADCLNIINKYKEEKNKPMKNFFDSIIRTYVPIAVGALAAWLLTLGLSLDANTQAGLVVFITGLLQAIYYGVVRWVEVKYPKIGVLLGKAKAPEYR